MANTNLSCILFQKGDIRLEERPIPDPAKGEVQIGIQKVGICGSDVHFWKNGAIGDFIVKAPMLLGHESSGVVTKVGDGVTHLKIDHVSLEEGALLEPLSVALHACRRAGVTIGSRVLVCGAGPIGLVNLLTAKAMGAAQVCMTDISPNRLEIGKKMGADQTLLIESREPREVAAKIVETMGVEPDITIECSGAEPSIQSAIYATAPGGVLVLVGLGQPKITMPIVYAALREVDIRGVLRYANCYPVALSMVANGQVDVKPLVTHHFSIEESIRAFETAHTGAGGAIKVMIDCAKK